MSQALPDKLKSFLTKPESPYVYYNSKDHKISEQLRPIMTEIKYLLTKLSIFFDKNIGPFSTDIRKGGKLPLLVSYVTR